jgi:hypothetical protein
MRSLLFLVCAVPGLAENPSGKSQINDPSWIDMLNKV